MDWLTSIFLYAVIAPVGVVLVFGFLIFIHELGHYAAGRYFGVPVEGFSIGFGPALLSFRDRHGTLWAFRLLPLGGFVKFQGDANAASQPAPNPAPRTVERNRGPQEKDAMESRVDALAQIALWKRAIVVAAGPAANIVLAFALLSLNFLIFGVNATPAKIGSVAVGSAAAEADFRPGDTVLSVNGRPTSNLYSLTVALESRLGQASDVQVQRSNGRQATLVFTPAPGLGRSASFAASGLAPAFEYRIIEILPETPAQSMGLRVGDVLSAYNETFITSLTQMGADLLPIAQAGGPPVQFQVERDGQRLRLEAVPAVGQRQTQGGTQVAYGSLGFLPERVAIRRALGPVGSARVALKEIQLNALLIFKLPAQFIAQQRSINDIGGPVRIAETIGTIAVNAPFLLIFIAALISLQLGILNLLPIPVLDGGHLLLYGAEAIWRRPLPPALVEWLYRVGFVVLISFMVMVTFNDLRIRLIGS